jgi:hypothetical protein
MKKHLLKYLSFLCLLISIQQAGAQGVGSVETNMGFGTADTDTTASVAETMFIGPGLYELEGVWEIYSKYIWISPDAVISGGGKIRFFNPSTVPGGIASTTYIDGNNVLLDINIDLMNEQNLVLADMVDPGFGNDLAGNASLMAGRVLNMAVDNGDVIMGLVFTDPDSENTPVGNTGSTITDLVFDNNATISNYSPLRMIVTSNSTQGHVVKQGYTGAFTFPVGIAEGDYTPAAVDNTITNTIHVSVQDYAGSASIEGGDDGIDRAWNIYADDAAANAVISLQHNGGTSQTAYNDVAAFVTQYSSATPNTSGQTTLSESAWQSNNLVAGSGSGTLTTGAPVASASVQSLTYTTLATAAADEIAFFTKSSDPVFPLPVKLLSFDGWDAHCSALLKWTTADEINVRYFELENSINGAAFKPVVKVSPKGNNSSYSYTDNNIISTAGISYRLHTVDIDGKESYSKIVPLSIDCGDPFVLKVYPNPVNDIVIISGLVPNSRIRLVDGSGRVLTNIIANSTKHEIDMRTLVKGIYLLQIVQDNKTVKSAKLIKK